MDKVRELFNRAKTVAANFFDDLPEGTVVISDEFENGRPVYYDKNGKKLN